MWNINRSYSKVRALWSEFVAAFSKSAYAHLFFEHQKRSLSRVYMSYLHIPPFGFCFLTIHFACRLFGFFASRVLTQVSIVCSLRRGPRRLLRRVRCDERRVPRRRHLRRISIDVQWQRQLERGHARLGLWRLLRGTLQSASKKSAAGCEAS